MPGRAATVLSIGRLPRQQVVHEMQSAEVMIADASLGRPPTAIQRVPFQVTPRRSQFGWSSTESQWAAWSSEKPITPLLPTATRRPAPLEATSRRSVWEPSIRIVRHWMPGGVAADRLEGRPPASVAARAMRAIRFMEEGGGDSVPCNRSGPPGQGDSDAGGSNCRVRGVRR